MASAPRSERRITIIPYIEGKITREGKVCEPDIYWIIERWLKRQPEVQGRERDIRILRGVKTLRPGTKTDLISVTIVAKPLIDGKLSPSTSSLKRR